MSSNSQSQGNPSQNSEQTGSAQAGQPVLADAAPSPDADSAEASANQAVYLRDYRPPAYAIDEVDLLVDLHEDHALITATLKMRPWNKGGGGESLWLHGQDLELKEITINGTPVEKGAHTIEEEGMRIEFSEAMSADFELRTVSRIRPQDNTRLEGLYRSSDMFCTQCEAEGFRRITWYIDRPDVMSVFRCTIEADREAYPVLLSNGNLVESTEAGEGRHRAVWEDPFRKPSYLFALVAGKLDLRTDTFTTMTDRVIDLHMYVDPGNGDKCEHALESLKRAMRWDEERYGREYDLDLFNIVAVDDFNMGAMENKSLNIFNSSCVLADPATASDASFDRVEAIVAHEYFHNWSGNRVTCRDWFQLSLKEGFTVYRDASFSADMHSAVVKRIEDVRFLRTAQFAEDAGPMAHPVRPESYMEIGNFYTLTVYEKGAEVVGMIHRLLGDELFRKGSDLYFERFDGQAVTTEDFVATMAEVSGRDMTQFKLWYCQAGTPQLTISDDHDARDGTYRLTVSQTLPATPGQTDKLPMHMPLVIGLVDDDGEDVEPAADSPALEAATVNDDGIMLELTEHKQTFVFNGVDDKPVVSLNRGFSAPVRIEYDYDVTELLHLMRYDSDRFNRWNAGQMLALSLFDRIFGRLNNGSQSVDPGAEITLSDSEQALVEEYAAALASYLASGSDSRKDPAYCSLLLQLPAFAAWIERLPQVDVQLALSCYEAASLAICRVIEDAALSCYEELGQDSKIADRGTGAELRSLRNTCLAILSRLDGHTELAWEHFDSATLMTDTLAGFAALMRTPPEISGRPAQAIAQFESDWSENALVMDNWFAMQASSKFHGGLDDIRRLADHPSFSRSNPNKLRSLYSTFAGQNWINFHAVDGSGYRFIREQIEEIDQNNPQIASRMATPLTRWRKYSQPYSDLLLAELEALMPDGKQADKGKRSKDLYEVVYKSLQ